MFIYTIIAILDISKLDGGTINEVNSFMHQCGFTETLVATSRVPFARITADIELTADELSNISKVAHNSIGKTFLSEALINVEIEKTS